MIADLMDIIHHSTKVGLRAVENGHDVHAAYLLDLAEKAEEFLKAYLAKPE